ncbi:NAD(P)/FAD-dependent oxidoreductase [Cohnella massiliensis]|uniref:NAD(P)/FAD-dependent oxidoreductase n=1 Tax=Cohnella massiliensis TaxID=1816691 RepID=UPI001593DF6A|nr:FAD-dependent oxidoreductase [Cohnella massiliensis]
MTLHYGSLYWPATRPNTPAYPALEGSAACKALIVGGGMTGILCGHLLARNGIDAIVIDRGKIASGSSSANTGLLQYANDTPLTELSRQIGEREAVAFYRECKQAVERLCLTAEALPRDVGVKRRSSLYFASVEADVQKLRDEYELLDRHDFGVEWWDGNRIEREFPFRKPAAIVTHGDGEINPYFFVTALAEDAAAHGLVIHEHTPMLSVAGEKGKFVVETGSGTIETEHLIYAVGYTPEEAGNEWVKAKLTRSYVIATEPLPSLAGWHGRYLLWETARPYLYIRTTPDNRIIAGGLDEPIRRPVMTKSELGQRSRRLLAELKRLFPGWEKELAVAYEWCGTFGESEDGLPWLGEDPLRPGRYCALGYGGNGTVYSAIASRIILDSVLGRKGGSAAARAVRLDR